MGAGACPDPQDSNLQAMHTCKLSMISHIWPGRINMLQSARPFFSTRYAHLVEEHRQWIQVLKGDLLPASVADEQLADLLRAMPSQPGMLERVVDGLFQLAPSSGAAAAFGGAAAEGAAVAQDRYAAWRQPAALAAAGVPAARDGHARGAVVAAVQQACAAHGAVHMHSSLVRVFGLQSCDAARERALSLKRTTCMILSVMHALSSCPLRVTQTATSQCFAAVPSSATYGLLVVGAVIKRSMQVGAAVADLPPGVVRMLGADAAQHMLRHNLRLPFSAWLVQTALAGIASTGAMPDGMRRFEIAQVCIFMRNSCLHCDLLQYTAVPGSCSAGVLNGLKLACRLDKRGCTASRQEGILHEAWHAA